MVGLRRLRASRVVERENDLFSERRRALLNHARTWALRGMTRAGYEVQASACILVQTVEPQSRGLDHGHIVLGHATKVEKAFARFFVDGLARFADVHGLGFVDRYSHALWKQRDYQGPGQAERAARYLSKYMSEERAADWLRAKAGRLPCSGVRGCKVKAEVGRPRCTDEE
jgi:hypothetical protein